MQTEKAKSSHFDRTRGDKNQIFPTYMFSSFWLLGVESRGFSHAEKERTAYKAEQIHKLNTTVSYTHLRAHETKANLVCRLLLEKKIGVSI